METETVQFTREEQTVELITDKLTLMEVALTSKEVPMAPLTTDGPTTKAVVATRMTAKDIL